MNHVHPQGRTTGKSSFRIFLSKLFIAYSLFSTATTIFVLNVLQNQTTENTVLTYLTMGHHKSNIQKVLVLPDADHNEEYEDQTELRHILLDGIKRSDKLQITYDTLDTEAVWVVYPEFYNCSETLVPVVKETFKLNHRQPWKIILYDMTDSGREYLHCMKEIVTLFNSTEYIHFATRAIWTETRMIEFKPEDHEDTPFHNLGEEGNWDYWTMDYVHSLDKNNMVKLIKGMVQPLRFGVRSDLVEFIDKIMQKDMGHKDIYRKVDIPALPRPKDAIHFWNIVGEEEEALSNLRNKVSERMVRLANETGLAITAHEVGEREAVGRESVQEEYVRAMLTHKIIVVSQRDEWEGHYRLMEALASGAMVMTDPMHPLPIDLSHKKNIIVYRSLAELVDYIKFYLDHEETRLQIASAGYHVAMTKHRSWHSMERLVLGDWEKFNWGEYSEPEIHVQSKFGDVATTK